MYKSERQNEILKILAQEGYASVERLSKLLYASESSIRRDLTHMQNSGLVKRSHGGVTLPDPIKGVASFYDRTQKNKAEKRIIAK
jgi:DeoR/GlpR family transcriptional regulator of sugar metabolism